eukprot:12326951-Alexandrium_andersonii.AAC.1
MMREVVVHAHDIGAAGVCKQSQDMQELAPGMLGRVGWGPEDPSDTACLGPTTLMLASLAR